MDPEKVLFVKVCERFKNLKPSKDELLPSLSDDEDENEYNNENNTNQNVINNIKVNYIKMEEKEYYYDPNTGNIWSFETNEYIGVLDWKTEKISYKKNS